MHGLLLVIHVLVCLFLVTVILLQSGRAGGMGVLSGAATQTVFGGRGASGFLARATSISATLFMLTCATLAYLEIREGISEDTSASDTGTSGANDTHMVGDAGHAATTSTADAAAAAPATTTTTADAAAVPNPTTPNPASNAAPSTTVNEPAAGGNAAPGTSPATTPTEPPAGGGAAH